jgi:hypothetical protein
VKCAPWGIVPANSFPVDSGIERVRGEEHAKAFVEFAYCYFRTELVSGNDRSLSEARGQGQLRCARFLSRRAFDKAVSSEALAIGGCPMGIQCGFGTWRWRLELGARPTEGEGSGRRGCQKVGW